MKPVRLGIIAIALFVTVCPVLSQGGATGLTFLTLGVGSRSLGMAEAYSAASDDPSAAQYNPATLTSIDATTISFMHRSWIQGTDAEFLAGAFSLGAVSLGLSLYSVSTGDIEVRDTPGPALSTFTARNAAFGISIAYAFSTELSLGVTAKYLYEKILVDDAGGTAFDVGGTYRTPFGVSVGASVSNLGSMSELGSEATSLPKFFRGGFSYAANLADHPATLTGAVDIVAPLGDGTSHVHFGGEALLYESISVRAGYQTGYEARGFTAGTGIRHGVVAIDYAFMPTRYELGATHAITLSLRLR
ncbi:MAG TPA: PorV/PorQ family protein [Bacteroidota bacterium]|nr:PorV/PorQ family protein [Bacteroidota bacterium]